MDIKENEIINAIKGELESMKKLGITINKKDIIDKIGKVKYYLLFWKRKYLLQKTILDISIK